MNAVSRYSYGPDGLNFADLHRTVGDAPRGTVILIHGGFWRWSADYFSGPTLLAEALVTRGWNVWQIEYRSVGSGGGWPTTLQDVGAAIDFVATIPDLSLGKVITTGHSAGGHLAVWALGHEGPIPLAGAISLAGVLDLKLAEHDRIGSGAAKNFLGGSSKRHPERYAEASPAEHPVAATPVRIIHGDRDFIVPMNQSLSYLEVARRAGQDVELVRVSGDHFAVIDVDDPAFDATLAAVTHLTF